MTNLDQKKCIPCSVDTKPLNEEEAKEYLSAFDGWKSDDYREIYKVWHFDDFKGALDFVNKVGEIAEEEGHHPNILFGWGYAKVMLKTSKIQGLHENDFILAAKIDKMAE